MVGSGPTPGAFDNAGWLRQSGEGHARLPFAVTNRGTLENTDTMTIEGGMTQPSEGILRLRGVEFWLGGTPRLLSGQIEGPGLVSQSGGGVFDDFVITARTSVGGTNGFGILTLDGASVRLGSESRVVMRVGGTEPGTHHDQHRGTEPLRLRGALQVEFVAGFTPVVGQKFTIVTAAPKLLTFRNQVDVIGLPAGLAIRLNYVGNRVEWEGL